MNIGLVVSTLGRTEPLERLLRSLTDQLTGDDHVVIVAQQRLAEVTALANRFRDAPWPITVTTSAPGAARGRNVGVAALPPGDRLLHFPNDTTWFPPGTLAAVRAAMGNGEGGVGALTIVDEHGPKFVLPPPGSSLTIWNVWQVIEMGILIRRSLFDQIGGFDPLLGTGALSPWQGGEATGLLLRLGGTRPGVAGSLTWFAAPRTVGGGGGGGCGWGWGSGVGMSRHPSPGCPRTSRWVGSPTRRGCRPVSDGGSFEPMAEAWDVSWRATGTRSGGSRHSPSVGSRSGCGTGPLTPCSTGGGCFSDAPRVHSVARSATVRQRR